MITQPTWQEVLDFVKEREEASISRLRSRTSTREEDLLTKGALGILSELVDLPQLLATRRAQTPSPDFPGEGD